MAIQKEHKKFFKVDLGQGWETPERYGVCNFVTPLV
jgi:hypothetical protein